MVKVFLKLEVLVEEDRVEAEVDQEVIAEQQEIHHQLVHHKEIQVELEQQDLIMVEEVEVELLHQEQLELLLQVEQVEQEVYFL